MSYILDALKKAERERRPAEVAQMVTAPDLPRKRKTVVWIIAGFGLLCMVAAGGLFLGMFYGRTESSIPAYTAVNQQGYTDEYHVAPPENRESSVQSTNPPPVSVEPILKPPAPEATNAPVAAKPVSVEPILKPPVPKTANIPVAAAPEAKPHAAVVEPVSPVPKAKTESAVAATADASMQKSPPVHDNAGLPAPGASIPAAAALEAQQIPGNIPSLREIASSMKMNIGMHVYSDNPEKRLVFINGKRYKEGDLLEQDCVIEGITPEGVLLKRREETVVLRLNGGL